MPTRHHQPHDLVEPPEPSAPEPLSCAVCRKEIPSAGAFSREYGDYTLWFCGADCYEKSAENQEPQDTSRK